MFNLKSALNTNRIVGIKPELAAEYIAKAERLSGFDLKDIAALLGNGSPEPIVEDGLGIMYYQGVVGSGLSPIEVALGGADIETATAQLLALEANPEVKRIAIIVDSPGGTISGVEEATDILANVSKPTAVATKGLLCSAAYWWASAADEVQATPSAEVVNAGVYISWWDTSAAAQAAGYKRVVVKSGEHKAAGLDGTSVTDAQLAEIQASVDEKGEVMREQIKRKRKFANIDHLQGQSYSGRKAAELGLITGVTPSIAAFIANQKAKAR